MPIHLFGVEIDAGTTWAGTERQGVMQSNVRFLLKRATLIEARAMLQRRCLGADRS
jgi:hypothetical protein